MHVGTVTMTDDRYKIFDLPYPWFVGPFQLVIPTTEAVANFGAPWQPFDYQVDTVQTTMNN